MIFRQLFEPLSCTYTYVLGCERSREAVLVDPVYPTWERDLQVLKDLGLKLSYTLETHVHADHITSALKMRQEAGSRIIFPAESNADCPDLVLRDNDFLAVGDLAIKALHTPGHTDDHYCYLHHDRLMTGDALLVDGCGRTDFQNGNTQMLFESIHNRLFTLPDDTLVLPGHDYNNRHISTVLQEKERNPRLGGGRSLEEFTIIMANLNLAHPKFIDFAVPGNRQCGVCPSHLPDKMAEFCQQMTQSPQG